MYFDVAGQKDAVGQLTERKQDSKKTLHEVR